MHTPAPRPPSRELDRPWTALPATLAVTLCLVVAGCGGGGGGGGGGAGGIPPITVAFDIDSSAVSETTGSIDIDVTLISVSAVEVSVPFTIAGTATPGVDFTAPASPVVIPAGSTTATITVPILDDGDMEGDETVVLTLGAATGATTDTPDVHTLTIQDDETPPTAEFTQTSFTVAEFDPAFDLTVQLSAIGAADATITFDVSGSASAPGDYTIDASPLVISAGSLTGTITVTPQIDSTPESAEMIVVTLTGATGATIGPDDTATISLIDAGSCTIEYPTEDALYGPGVPIAANVPAVSCGSLTDWMSMPALPTGLMLDPNDGTISGTPTVEQPATSYTISGEGPGGSIISTMITIRIGPRFILSGTEPTVMYDPADGLASFTIAIDLLEEASAVSPTLLAGYSFGLAVDATELTVDGIFQGSATSGFDMGMGADFFQANLESGGLTVGAVFSFAGTETLDATTTAELLTIDLSTVPTFLQGNGTGDTATLVFDDSLGIPPVAVIVTEVGGTSQFPVLLDPTITFSP